MSFTPESFEPTNEESDISGGVELLARMWKEVKSNRSSHFKMLSEPERRFYRHLLVERLSRLGYEFCGEEWATVDLDQAKTYTVLHKNLVAAKKKAATGRSKESPINDALHLEAVDAIAFIVCDFQEVLTKVGDKVPAWVKAQWVEFNCRTHLRDLRRTRASNENSRRDQRHKEA